MPTPIAIRGLLAKIEGTYGTDPTPTNTDNGVRITGPLWPELTIRDEFPNLRDDVVSGTLIPVKPGVPRGRLVELDIPVEFKGKGTAYAALTDLEIYPLLLACGLSVTLDTTGGAEKITATPADSSHGSCTIWAYSGADVYKITGCRGNLVWSVAAGRLANLRFRMIGMLATDPTAAALPTITYDSATVPAAVGMSFLLAGSYAPDVRVMEFDLGNDLQVIEDAGASDGIQGIEIPTRNPIVTCEIRKDALTSWDTESIRRAVTNAEIDWTIGAAQYNRLKLDVNESYIIAPPRHLDYKGFNGLGLTFGVKQVSLIAG
jgi:hypothetical protein